MYGYCIIIITFISSVCRVDRFNDLFETLGENESRQSFPPYDIVKTAENHYKIVMAVAGYDEENFSITVEKDALKVSANTQTENDETIEYIHRGIAQRNFERTFRLADHMYVEKADLDKGVLTISLYREVPEEQQLKTIAINQPVN